MKRTYILMFSLLSCTVAGAQTVGHEHSACDNDSIDPMKEAILSEITVEGVTGSQRLKDSPIPFAVISPKVLHGGFGTNLVDAIAHQPGLTQITTGAGISKPVIRGLGYNRVVVVEQGIRQEGQQWGDEHGLEVDAEGVHSVEVLKGPASLMYGSDAIAGVMILHPEHALDDQTMQVRVGGEYQSNNGLYDYHIGYAGNLNGWIWNWHLTEKAAHCYKNSRDGYVPGTWFNEHDVQGLLGKNSRWGHSWLRFSNVNFTPGITEGERDEDTGELEWEEGSTAKSYDRQLPFQRVVHTKVVSDNAWFLGNGQLKAIVGYQQNYRREFEEAMDEAELAMRLHTVNYDVKYQWSLSDAWKMATGVGGMWQQNVNQGEEFLIPDYRLFDLGAFITAGRQLERLNVSGGLRFDNRHLHTETLEEEGALRFESLNKNFSGVTGSLGLVYNATDALNLRLNIARGFRAPTVSELSSNGVHEGSIQYEIGNYELRPEYSFQGDLGLDYTTHYVNLQASAFLNRISNYIYLSRLDYETEGYRTYQYTQGDAQLVGGELSLDIHPVDPLHIENSFSYVRGIQLHQSEDDMHNLPMIPAPRWNLDLRYELPDFLHHHFRRSHIAFSMEYNLCQDNFFAFEDTETATPDYAVCNLSLSTDLHLHGHNCIELSLVCQNFFDKAYQSHLSRLKYTDGGGICAMGRNFAIKVNIPLDIHLK